MDLALKPPRQIGTRHRRGKRDWAPRHIRLTLAILWLALSFAVPTLFSQERTDKEQAFAIHMQKAAAYLREKQAELAIPELMAAVAINPKNVDAQANLGVLLFFQGHHADAIPHLRAALEGRHDLVKIQGLLGLAEIRTYDIERGRRDLAATFPLITDTPFKVQVGLELSSLYTQTGDLNEAASVLAQLTKDAPENPEVLYASYRTYMDLAGESMLALSIHAPDSPQMHQLMAHEETRQGKTNKAIAQYHQAIALNPHLPGVHFELAELLHTSQDEVVKKEAEQEYRAALSDDPQDEKSICRLAEIDARKGNLQKSLEEFSSAAKLQPTDSDAELGMAKALIHLNQSDEALTLLEKTVKDEPTNEVAHYRLALLYRKKGRMKDARREVEIYKTLRDAKEKLRIEYKDLEVQPSEIRADKLDGP